MPRKGKLLDGRVGSWSNEELVDHILEEGHAIVSNEWDPFRSAHSLIVFTRLSIVIYSNFLTTRLICFGQSGEVGNVGEAIGWDSN